MNMKLQEIIKMLQDETQLHIDTMKKIEQELINQKENINNKLELLENKEIVNMRIGEGNIVGKGITIKNGNNEIVLIISQDGIKFGDSGNQEKEENETDKFINFLLDLDKRITKLENNKLDSDIKNISNKVAENIINGLKRMDVNFK